MNSLEYTDTIDRPERESAADEIYSVPVKAGKRIYYFDVKATRANDYYVTITESRKRVNRDGSTTIDKHKIHLYKEDFEKFAEGLQEVFNYIKRTKPEVEDLVQPQFSGEEQTKPEINYGYAFDLKLDAAHELGRIDDLNPRIPTEEEFFGGL